MTSTDFSIGIEEEYLLVDRDSLLPTAAPEGLLEACQKVLGDQVSPELLNCQIEIGTKVCEGVAEARADLARLRTTVAAVAGRYNLAPVAVSCHPMADWTEQTTTDKDRYNELERDMASLARRMLICGMHVHVGIGSKAERIDLMGQLAYFLPHLLALSVSSPFWRGEDTGLSSYRLTVFDGMPRTGLPPKFAGWDEYRRAVDTMVDLELIEDSTKIWWDLRPSHKYPTLETRICDVTPRMSDALALAGLTQCIARMLHRLRMRNQRWRLYDPFLIAENRWRAQRYGATEGLIDFGRGAIVPLAELVEELLDLVAEDAAALGCEDDIAGVRRIVSDGTSAARQRTVRAEALEAGQSGEDAMRAVVQHLIEEYHADL